MERKMGINTLLYVMSSWNQIPTIELINTSGLLKNIVPSRTKVATYNDGESILLSRTFLNAEWKYVEKHKTFVEAYTQAHNEGKTQIIGLIGNDYRFTEVARGASAMSLIELPLSDMSFKDLVEGKIWDVYESWSTPLDGTQASSPNEPYNHSFTEAVDKMLKASVPHYMIQFNTGKKIHLDVDEIKDASTNQLVELDASLYLGGQWYVGEDVTEIGGTNMTLTEAVGQADLSTQDLVFLAGTTKEFRIYGKYVYEEVSLYNAMPKHIRDTETIHTILFANSWSLAPAYTGA